MLPHENYPRFKHVTTRCDYQIKSYYIYKYIHTSYIYLCQNSNKINVPLIQICFCSEEFSQLKYKTKRILQGMSLISINNVHVICQYICTSWCHCFVLSTCIINQDLLRTLNYHDQTKQQINITVIN